MYDQQILEELEQQNSYLYTITQNQSTLHNDIIQLQQQINSGDMLTEELIKETNQNITMITLVLVTTLIFTFIMRCLK